MTNTVIYARSTANEMELQNQIKTLTEFAEEKNLNIKGIFSDTDKEKKGLKNAFQLLDIIEDAQILVININRITRDIKEMQKILEKYNVITPNMTYEQLVSDINSTIGNPLV